MSTTEEQRSPWEWRHWWLASLTLGPFLVAVRACLVRSGVIGLLAGRSVPVGVRGDAALALLTNVGYDEGVLKALTEMRKRREAAWVLAGGVAVAAAPAFWYSQVWPDAGRYGQDTNPTRSAWWFVFACSIGPFILVAALREAGSMSRVATYTAAVVVAVSVVLGQLAGLDPHDPSSTGSIAVVTTAVGAAMLVVIIFVVDEQIRAAVSRRRQAEENP